MSLRAIIEKKEKGEEEGGQPFKKRGGVGIST